MTRACAQTREQARHALGTIAHGSVLRLPFEQGCACLSRGAACAAKPGVGGCRPTCCYRPRACRRPCRPPCRNRPPPFHRAVSGARPRPRSRLRRERGPCLLCDQSQGACASRRRRPPSGREGTCSRRLSTGELRACAVARSAHRLRSDASHAGAVQADRPSRCRIAPRRSRAGGEEGHRGSLSQPHPQGALRNDNARCGRQPARAPCHSTRADRPGRRLLAAQPIPADGGARRASGPERSGGSLPGRQGRRPTSKGSRADGQPDGEPHLVLARSQAAAAAAAAAASGSAPGRRCHLLPPAPLGVPQRVPTFHPRGRRFRAGEHGRAARGHQPADLCGSAVRLGATGVTEVAGGDASHPGKRGPVVGSRCLGARHSTGRGSRSDGSGPQGQPQ